MTTADQDIAKSSGEWSPISVVVIGRNEGERLIRCLESVRSSDYPADKIELIYVDTDSTDESCDVARRLGADVLSIHPGRPSAARARNAGLRVARHGLVHFLDGDTIVHPSWFGKAVAAMKRPNVACVFGRREEIHPRASLYMRVADVDWYVPPGAAKYCGGDALFRKDVLNAVGPFENSLIAGEEPELCYRIRKAGRLIWRCDEPMTRHDLNMTRMRQYWRRGVRSGWAYVVVATLCRAGTERLWLRENIANVLEVFLWFSLVVIGILAATWSAAALLAALILARTAFIARRARARTDGWMSSLLYGLNCQFMRIPLLVGQIMGLRYLVFSRSAALLEYK